jgi:hypothetical protein
LSGLPRFLARLVDRLEKAGIPYMVTGSLSGVLHGEPRSSRDVDVVIECDRSTLERFLVLVENDFYVSRDEAGEALEKRALFNIVDLETGWKADLIIRKERAYSREEFERRTRAELHGISLFVVSPEDAVLSKLEWSKESRSELQARDVAAICHAQRGRLDVAYLRRWAKELDVEDELERVLTPSEA